VDFGSVEQSSAIEKLVKVSYAGRTNWRIVDVRSASEHLEVELTETGRSGGRVDYDMLIRLKPEAPAGLVQEQLTVVSDDSRNQTIPLIVVGRVSAALEVNPSSWFLGTLDPGQSATRKLVLRGKQPFKIVSVKCEDQRFEIDRAGGDEKKALHVIPVTFKAGNTPGQVNATIEIETDMGTGVATKCLTTGTIREPNGDAKSDSKGAAKNEP
jgi:hypothetical protein